jgi:hypothetical protein
VNSFSNLIGSKKEYVLTGELFELANLLIGFYETIDIVIPVVPHKAVAEVSKIGNL